MDKQSAPVQTREEVIDGAVRQFREFLEKNFNGKKIRVNSTVSVATNGTEVMFTLQSPEGEVRPLASNKYPQVLKQTHLEILAEETFENIRNPAIRTMGREVIQLITMSDIKTITAAEIITLFKKNRLPLYGKHKHCFQTELSKVNQALTTKYGCRIMRYNDAEFSHSLNRHFALFMITTKTSAAEIAS